MVSSIADSTKDKVKISWKWKKCLLLNSSPKVWERTEQMFFMFLTEIWFYFTFYIFREFTIPSFSSSTEKNTVTNLNSTCYLEPSTLEYCHKTHSILQLSKNDSSFILDRTSSVFPCKSNSVWRGGIRLSSSVSQWHQKGLVSVRL